jgi:protein FRA10AC1
MSKPPPRRVQNVVSAADRDALEKAYTFILPDTKSASSWQDRVVQRYHDGLHKEFALADLSRLGKVGLRWRTKQEVVNGRGEWSCGNKQCQNSSDLITLEIPFSYDEGGVAKKEMVKLTLCPSCRPLINNNKPSKTDSTRRYHDRIKEVDKVHNDRRNGSANNTRAKAENLEKSGKKRNRQSSDSSIKSLRECIERQNTKEKRKQKQRKPENDNSLEDDFS